jgi:UDP-glucose 4-epimerase
MLILVSGGAGFIGSNLVDTLINKGFRVRVIDNLTTGGLENLSDAKSSGLLEFVDGSVTSDDDVDGATKGVDAVFHEAALVSIPQSLDQPGLVNRVNVEGTLALLEACRRHDVKHFIFASSCSVYGNPSNLPISEDEPPKPLSPYAASKLSAEIYCQTYWRLYALPTTILRYFNVYGPRQTATEYSGVISRFLDAVLENRHLTILGSGEQTRDFVHVDDVAEANLRTLNSKEAFGNVYNIATGQAVSIEQLAATTLKVFRKDTLGFVHEPPKPGDILHSCANISKARHQLGFEPKISLRDGLQKVMDWYKTHDRV